jgi:hypothetical protein
MCTERWLHENFPKHRVFSIGFFSSTLYNYSPFMALYNAFLFLGKYLVLKLKIGKDDFFIGHSGYFMIDHHSGWKMFADIIRFFPKRRIIIFPQTINFYTPYIRKFISDRFAQSEKVTLMCRDEVSFKKAKDLFPKTKLLLFPDIVTTLIGEHKYPKNRNGVLFCLRNDIEALYSEEELQNLIQRFKDYRIDRVDTSLDVSELHMKRNRDRLIWQMIEKFSMFQVVITDRYHGTIFAAVAATPVIVLNSADHKLSSGVKWFPEEFSDYVYFADNMNDAYLRANEVLSNYDFGYKLPAYFQENYYKKLKDLL